MSDQLSGLNCRASRFREWRVLISANACFRSAIWRSESPQIWLGLTAPYRLTPPKRMLRQRFCGFTYGPHFNVRRLDSRKA